MNLKIDFIDILWIDDHCNEDKLKFLIESAKEKGVRLNGYEYGVAGIKALKERFNDFDAILLDVKSKFHKDDKDEISNIDLITEEIQKIIARKTDVPIFYLTSKYSESMNRFPKARKVFNKSDILFEKDYSIWDSINQHVKDNKITVLKKKYKDVIEVGELIDLKINLNIKNKIVDLALHVSGEKCDEPFIRIRKILDSLFLFLYKIGEGNEHYISKNTVNLTAAFQYFQYNQTQQRERNGVPDYRIKNKSPKFIPLSKKIDNEWKVFTNKSSWPTDISTILFYLIGDETPVQALNHEQIDVRDDVESHFQNLKSNKYHSYIYINLLFTLLLWIKKRYRL